jgi:hypothetical protein
MTKLLTAPENLQHKDNRPAGLSCTEATPVVNEARGHSG